MVFKEALEKLRAFNLPNYQFVLVGSAPLAIRGIREAHDIDIATNDTLWHNLSKKYHDTNEFGLDIHLIDEDITALKPGSLFRNSTIVSIDDMIKTADLFDGIRFLNLELLRRFKLKLAREKDLKDILLIDQYLATHSNL